MKDQGTLFFINVIFAILFLALALFYGPWSFFRDFWITTAMQTKSHQYLATMLYDDTTIQRVLNHHQTVEVPEITDLDLITMKKDNTNKNKFEEKIKNHDKKDLYQIIPIQGHLYRGTLVVIYDASKVKLAVSKKIGEEGEKITTIAKDNKASIVINASGFLDFNWNSNGAIAHGAVIQNGRVISDYQDATTDGGLIGFTKDHKLFLGKVSIKKALQLDIVDAVEFGPFLLVNGKSSTFVGNGGWGRAPRTAIGQRKDGIVLFLVINGRIPSSVGATMKDLMQIMRQYGAMNAANLDGGSSTELWIKGKIYNKPVGGGENGLRAMPTFWIVQ